MWVSDLSQVRNMCPYTLTNLNSLIWVQAIIGNTEHNMYIAH
jgi:hypothetical protein